MSHTPGPWKFNDKGDDRILSEAPALCMALVTGGLDGEADFGPTSAANGRLIAAAPDLLEVVKQSLDWLASYPGGGATAMYGRARAAIAKAEGQS